MKKYDELYNTIKKEITTEQLLPGAKLPSVRKAAAIYGVSRTTVQNAYFALAADGFIISEPQSGYYNAYKKAKETDKKQNNSKNNILYDFKSGNADKNSFEFNLWRRYMKNALRQDKKLLSYGEVQGEYELRDVLSDYIREKRNVTSSPNRIVIGTGHQSLLGVLCSLIDEKGTVSFPDKSFIQGASLFDDYGFEVKYRYKDADIIYVSPSHMNKRGDVMPNKRRIELVDYSSKNGSLIIEDDYESDFQYSGTPAPSLHALTGGENVIYISSFSNLLLPSIRISFMVLTEELAEKYENEIYKYNQTAGKTEQIALAQYIRDGHLKAQIRKTRRFYTAKTKAFSVLLANEFKNAEIEISENALKIIMSIPFNKSMDIFEKNGISVLIESYENGILKMILNPSAVPQDMFYEAVKALKSALGNNE
ncbi:MAG: PLP-dependent aminotransferase family protein [Clostridiales bacterium]|nr:PLP-dependent aminotransferase family protein [Clostridiales bacterium]